MLTNQIDNWPDDISKNAANFSQDKTKQAVFLAKLSGGQKHVNVHVKSMAKKSQSSRKFNATSKSLAAEWEQFIEDFNGFGCQQMCQGQIPTRSTRRLFHNHQTAQTYCQWCAN